MMIFSVSPVGPLLLLEIHKLRRWVSNRCILFIGGELGYIACFLIGRVNVDHSNAGASEVKAVCT